LHRVGMEPARNHTGDLGHCVGCLMDIDKAGYAKARRATLRWNQGFAWGEFCEDDCIVRLEQKSRNTQTWRMPV
jgi:hypothetical protein